MSAVLDQVLASVSRLTGGPGTLFVSPRDTVLIVRHRTSSEDPGTWGFPIGLADEQMRRVDREFEPTLNPARDAFNWVYPSFVLTVDASLLHPDVKTRLNHPSARIACADSTEGDSKVSTTIQDLQRKIDGLERRVGPPPEGREKFIAAQSRAEPLYRAIGDSAPPFVGSERLLEYRTRLLAPFQQQSAKFKTVDLSKIGDAVAFEVIEDGIYADAAREAVHPTGGFSPGALHAVSTADASGRPITRYHGDPNACWDQFNPPVRYVRRFLTAAR